MDSYACLCVCVFVLDCFKAVKQQLKRHIQRSCIEPAAQANRHTNKQAHTRVSRHAKKDTHAHTKTNTQASKQSKTRMQTTKKQVGCLCLSDCCLPSFVWLFVCLLVCFAVCLRVCERVSLSMSALTKHSNSLSTLNEYKQSNMHSTRVARRLQLHLKNVRQQNNKT